MFVGVSFNASKVSLSSNSQLDVGWYLNVHIAGANGAPLPGTRVRALDKNNNVLFDVLTNVQGDIATQEVYEYTRTGSSQTFYTPITLETTKTGYASDTRQVLLTSNRSLTVTLQPVGASNTAPTAEAGPDQTAPVDGAVTFDGSGVALIPMVIRSPTAGISAMARPRWELWSTHSLYCPWHLYRDADRQRWGPERC